MDSSCNKSASYEGAEKGVPSAAGSTNTVERPGLSVQYGSPVPNRDDICFRVRLAAEGVRAWGDHHCFIGHRIHHASRGEREGIFVEWHWDGDTFTLINDRYGIFPAYYYWDGADLIVSPSLNRIIRELGGVEIDGHSVGVYLRLGYYLGQDTPFRGLQALPPACTITWTNGVFRVSSDPPQPTDWSYGYEQALDEYMDRVGDAFACRPPNNGGVHILPLTGGRDSRHIAIELARHGTPPDWSVTAQDYPPNDHDDLCIAALVSEKLGIPHQVLRQSTNPVEAEIRKNGLTGFCGTVLHWYLVVADALNCTCDTVYDGLAGDVLSHVPGDQSRVQAISTALSRGETERVANWILGDRENLVRRLVPQVGNVGLRRDTAISRVAAELDRHKKAPNPYSSFFFWNRTRRAVALAPYGLLTGVPLVYVPFLDSHVFDLMYSTPWQVLLDDKFHTKALHRRYPDWKNVPFDKKRILKERGQAAHLRLRSQAGDVRRLLFSGNAPPQPRLLRRQLTKGLLHAMEKSGHLAYRYSWILPIVGYLAQLETASRGQQ